MEVADTGNGSNTVQLVDKILIASTRESLSGFIDGGATYAQKHETVFHESQAGSLVPTNASHLPDGVTMNVEWVQSGTILIIDLRAETSNLVTTTENSGIKSVRVNPRSSVERECSN